MRAVHRILKLRLPRRTNAQQRSRGSTKGDEVNGEQRVLPRLVLVHFDAVAANNVEAQPMEWIPSLSEACKRMSNDP